MEGIEEEMRANFLKKFNKKVIGWFNDCVSVEEWTRSNKLEQIEDLNLRIYLFMLDHTNLYSIP